MAEPQQPTIPTQTRLSPQERADLEALAKRGDRTLSTEMRRAVRFYIRARRSRKAAA